MRVEAKLQMHESCVLQENELSCSEILILHSVANKKLYNMIMLLY